MAFPTIPTGARLLVLNQLNTTATRTFPAFSGLTHANGDRIIAIVVGYQSSTTDAQFSGWSNGFSEIHDTGTSTTLALGVAYKDVTGTESGSLTVTQAATITGDASMILMSIPAGTFDPGVAPIVGTRVSGTSAAADPASLAPGLGALDFLWIAIAASGMTSGTGSWTATGTTAPSNYTDRVDTNASDTSTIGDTEAAVAFRQLNASSEDVGTAGVDTSNARNAALVIAIAPAASVQVDIDPPSGAALAGSTSVASFVAVELMPREGGALGAATILDVDTSAPITVDVDPPAGAALAGSTLSIVDSTAQINIVAPGAAAAGAGVSSVVSVLADVDVSPASGGALGSAGSNDVNAQAVVEVEPRSPMAWAGAKAPDVSTAAVASVEPLSAAAVAGAAAPAVSVQVVVAVFPPTGVAIAVGSVSAVTSAIPSLIDPPSGPGVGIGPSVVAHDITIQPSTGHAVGGGVAPLVSVTQSVAIAAPAGYAVATAKAPSVFEGSDPGVIDVDPPSGAAVALAPRITKHVVHIMPSAGPGITTGWRAGVSFGSDYLPPGGVAVAGAGRPTVTSVTTGIQLRGGAGVAASMLSIDNSLVHIAPFGDAVALAGSSLKNLPAITPSFIQATKGMAIAGASAPTVVSTPLRIILPPAAVGLALGSIGVSTPPTLENPQTPPFGVGGGQGPGDARPHPSDGPGGPRGGGVRSRGVGGVSGPKKVGS